MNILVIGGTGFIGYHVVVKAIQRGNDVTAVAHNLPPDRLFPPRVHVETQDIESASDAELAKLLGGYDALVFAAGVDDRTVPKAPAYDFFFSHNVKPVAKLCTLAREAGLKRAIVLGSYFAHFDRKWPSLEMSRYHPYIRGRVEQSKAAFEASRDGLETIVLELPYIFGSTPGRTPLWSELIKYVESPLPLLYTAGGTNAISVKNVAEAILGALERGNGGEIYTIGDENVTWKELLERISRITGNHQKMHIIPRPVVSAFMRGLQTKHVLQGRESGLHPVEFVKIQTSNTFFDPSASRKVLGYGSGDLNEALEDTIRACRSQSMSPIP